MSNIVTTTVSVDVSEITKEIQNIINSDETMTEVHEAFASILDPYVPYDTGNMSQDEISIDADGVTYYAEYAAKQYYGVEFKHTKDTHPLATAYWDKVAMQTQQEAFAQEVADIIARRLSNG